MIQHDGRLMQVAFAGRQSIASVPCVLCFGGIGPNISYHDNSVCGICVLCVMFKLLHGLGYIRNMLFYLVFTIM